jgi:hypothetical protein
MLSLGLHHKRSLDRWHIQKSKNPLIVGVIRSIALERCKKDNVDKIDSF